MKKMKLLSCDLELREQTIEVSVIRAIFDNLRECPIHKLLNKIEYLSQITNGLKNKNELISEE